ncbi:MAG: TolA-binding protein [Arenicella sp.]|jgi:TolA-binding protein
MKQIFSLLLVLLFAQANLVAQNTFLDTKDLGIYRDALELFDKKKYGAAQRKFNEYKVEGDSEDKRVYSQYYVAVCALFLKQASAEKMISSFITEHPVHPASNSAYFDLGNYYFEQQNFKKATKYLQKNVVPTPITGRDIEATYKLGYSYYFQKNYAKAKPLFNKVKTGLHKYVSLASYYSGQLAYKDGNMETAVTDFQRAASDPQFRDEVDGILPVIFYRQQKYDVVKGMVLDYESTGRKMNPNLSLLAGEIYFRENDFVKAEKYLSEYVKSDQEVDRGVHYRLGMSDLRINERADAIKYLSKAADGEDELAQMAAYHMGITYLSLKKPELADIAFNKVRNLTFDKELQEMGAYYYTKVNYDAENFSEVEEGNTFYQEQFPSGKYAEELSGYAGVALFNLGNYEQALQKLDKKENKSTKEQQVYQQIAYNKGALDFNDGNFRTAVDNLKKSQRYPISDSLKNKANYWIAEAYAIGNKYTEASAYYKQVESKYDIYTAALYGLGYVQYNQKKYADALSSFKSYIERPGNNDRAKKMDALVRLADCYYVTKNYDQAINVYNGAIRANAEDLDYVYYQKALAELGSGQLNAANQTLDFILLQFPASKHLDRVYFEKAELNYEAGRRDEATKWYGKFIEQFPRHAQIADVYAKRGLAYNLDGNSPLAVRDYKFVIDNYPTSSGAESAIRSLQEINNNGYRVASLAEYRRKFSIANPQSSVGLETEFGAASKAFNDGDYELATHTLLEFLRKYPSSQLTDDANYKLGQSYQYSDNPKQAVVYYKKVEGTSKLRATKSAADLELGLGLYSDAVTDYLVLKRIAPSKAYESFAILGLMQSYFGIDDYEAVNIYASQIINENMTRYKNQAYLYKGKALLAQKRYTDAVSQLNYTTQVSTGKEGAEAQYLIGKAYREQKSYDLSNQAFIGVQKKFENYPEWVYNAYLLLAENFVDLGNISQAKGTLESIIEKAKDTAVVTKAKIRLEEL